MITASAQSEQLAQRLRVRAERLAAARLDAIERPRHDSAAAWRSAAALWPDFIANIRRS
jgi:hypothetical protein